MDSSFKRCVFLKIEVEEADMAKKKTLRPCLEVGLSSTHKMQSTRENDA